MLCVPPEGTEMSLMLCADAMYAGAMCAVCNDVTCVMLVVNDGFRLPRVSAHMAETYTETTEFIK